MLLSLVKRRWPVLTTVVAALLYVVNNYDIRGLDAVHLEPRAPFAQVNTGWGEPSAGWAPGTSGPAAAGWNSGAAWNAGGGWSPLLPSGPKLPASSQPAPGLAAGLVTGPATGPAMTGLSPSAGYHASPGAPSANPYVGASGYGTPVGFSSPAADGGLAGDRGEPLSLGEKLGMLDQVQTPAGLGGEALPVQAGAAPRDAIRIASFNLHGWGDAQRDNVAVARLLIRLLSEFDLIALQDIRSRQDNLLPELVNQLNAGSRKYDFMIGPRIGRGERREQLAFVFDTQRIETDRFQLYTVEDPQDMLSREPLVGWFRTAGLASQEAFTFSLVNLHLDPDLVQSELKALPELLQAIAADGRGEDDIILAGDFGAAAAELEFLSASGMRVLLDGVATTTRGTRLVDNFAFPQASTTEFNGRSGALDFLRQFNLSLEQAVAVSEHLPIWAEFSIIEGGRPGQVAGNAPPEHRFIGGVR